MTCLDKYYKGQEIICRGSTSYHGEVKSISYHGEVKSITKSSNIDGGFKITILWETGALLSYYGNNEMITKDRIEPLVKLLESNPNRTFMEHKKNVS